ncbi:MAG: (2Fe-2S) ferredoxin domain-containing protein [Candidatus Cloacimonetes bacterium]|nr:(2Fe-2S) ferredoxin domain-containing protein [Candidatus Cloacimonadota bacterium]
MKTLDDLRKIRKKAQQEMKLRESNNRIKIVISMGTSGIAMGAREVMKAILDEVSNRNLTDVLVTQTGEKGLSSMEPVIDVIEEGKQTVTYGNITTEKARKIIAEHIVNGKVVNDFVITVQS